MNRIVSLIASATEIVCRLGLRSELVGVSHECDFPNDVTNLPACSSPKINVHGSSREIDDRVKAALQDALSVYDVRRELLEDLQPTIVITQTQCDVCAVNLQDVEAVVGEWLDHQPKIVSLEPNELQDVWQDILRVAQAAEVTERGTDLVADLKASLSALSERTAQLHPPSIACIEWLDPLMAAGNWIPELVQAAGGRNLFGQAGTHSPWITWEELVNADPDVIVTMPCGFDIARTLEEQHLLTEHPAWAGLRAVREGRIYVLDGNAYFNRPGPRLVDSAYLLAEVLHPSVFPSTFQGSGWIRDERMIFSTG